jgi:hypothetical protein
MNKKTLEQMNAELREKRKELHRNDKGKSLLQIPEFKKLNSELGKIGSRAKAAVNYLRLKKDK